MDTIDILAENEWATDKTFILCSEKVSHFHSS